MENEERQIDGYSISEINQYLVKNEEEYLQRFSQIDRKRNLTEQLHCLVHYGSLTECYGLRGSYYGSFLL